MNRMARWMFFLVRVFSVLHINCTLVKQTLEWRGCRRLEREQVWKICGKGIWYGRREGECKAANGHKEVRGRRAAETADNDVGESRRVRGYERS